MALEFVDLFCGAGGLSLGLRKAGLRQRLAVDADEGCVATYRRNFPRANVRCAKVEDLRPRDIWDELDDPERFVLAGCPPCQLFSRLHQKQPGGDHVIYSYLKLVRRIRAPYVVFENVPQITAYSDVWSSFTGTLRGAGYNIWSEVVNAADFGVPQNRKRLLVIATLEGSIAPARRPRRHQTVREAIADLPFEDPTIANHTAMEMSDANRARIRRTKKDGGNHRQGRTFSDSYSRMFWDKAAPTITTRCVSFSNGRFGHPEYHRALTVREAARLQGFPDHFVFEGGVWTAARQVGNAVPPPLASWMGRMLLNHHRLIEGR